MGLAIDGPAHRLAQLPGTGRFVKGTRARHRLDAKPKCYAATLECTTPHCQERIKAYDEHVDWRDNELAEYLGMKENSFAAWRLQHGLPPKPGKIAYHLQRPKWSRHSPMEIQRRIACYTEHPEWTDTQMAVHLGISRSNIRDFRVHHGLPPHRRRGERPEGTRLDASEEARRIAAYHRLRGRGKERDAARELGIDLEAYTLWRRARNLPPTSTAPVGRGARAVRGTPDALMRTIHGLEAYLATSTDEESGERLGMQPKTFRYWRRRAGLPARNRGRWAHMGGAPIAMAQLETARRELQKRNLADAAARQMATLPPSTSAASNDLNSTGSRSRAPHWTAPQSSAWSTRSKGLKNASTMRSGDPAGSINMHREARELHAQTPHPDAPELAH